MAYKSSIILNSSIPATVDGILSTTTGINAKTVANTLLYTVPAGKICIVTQAIVRCTAATAITVGPTLSMGRNGTSYNDVYASAVLTALINTGPGAGSGFGFGTIGMFAQAAAAEGIYVALTNASTGTSQTLAIDLLGYLL